jgi:hypothetical protein
MVALVGVYRNRVPAEEVAGALGSSFGGTVGTTPGGGLAMKSPGHPSAAERRITVRLDDPSGDAERVMAEHRPIRLDRVVGARRTATLATDGEDGITETLHDFRGNGAEPRRQG